MAPSALTSTAILVLLSLRSAFAHYTPTWAVHVPDGEEAADAVALDHGFINLGQIFDNHYHFHHSGVSRRSTTIAHAHHDKLETDTRVRWARQQKALSRKKRDFLTYNLSTTAETKPSNAPAPAPSSASKRDTWPRREYQPMRVKGRPRAADSKFQLNDPKWQYMWYLNRGGGLDMNVIPAWREGITGKGVVVTILDDGLETDHPDLLANYDPMASYDVNNHDSNPQPRYDMIDSNRHGTRCAGEVAATANNSLCAVGVAFGARVGGVRMLDGEVTDAVEARSLSLNPQHVDIYSASWGPDDDGKTVDGPGELATRAFIEGVTKGRNGKGSIFVWASGNGGREQDNCNCDGYTNSIWTLSISSATERGEVPWYSEMCSSTLAATYSSGAINEKQVITTDLHHSCTIGHTGTSASAPLAAGICALALQANKDLTWRDMQHIVVRTARPERLSAAGQWRVNGVGRNVSHSFGYGLLDAAGMVKLARSWKTVPPQKRCELAAPRTQHYIPPRSSIKLQLYVDSCPGVSYLEHVQARVSIAMAVQSSRRGDLRITLSSPAGTNVTLLAPRPHDSSRAGFTSWPFMSVHMWGESPIGVWQLEVANEGRYKTGPLTQWELIFYGTETPPQDEDVSVEGNGLSANANAANAGSAVTTWSIAHEPESVEEGKQNTIDDDLALGWHNMHSIREQSESPADASQFATAGCAHPAQLHLCLECEKGLHLYDGLCYQQCPKGTYASEVSMDGSSRLRNLTQFSENTNDSQRSVKRDSYDSEELSLETADMAAVGNNKDLSICLPCHSLCATCSGPQDYQCLSCLEGAQLISINDTETQFHCYPNNMTSLADNTKSYSKTNIILLVVLSVACFIVLYLLIALLLKRFNIYDGGGHYGTNIKNVTYNKLAVDDNLFNAYTNAEKEKVLRDSSESESEDDFD